MADELKELARVEDAPAAVVRLYPDAVMSELDGATDALETTAEPESVEETPAAVDDATTEDEFRPVVPEGAATPDGEATL